MRPSSVSTDVIGRGVKAVLAGANSAASASTAAFTAGVAAACTPARRPPGAGALGAAARTHSTDALLPVPWILTTWQQREQPWAVSVTSRRACHACTVCVAHTCAEPCSACILGRRVSEPAHRLW